MIRTRTTLSRRQLLRSTAAASAMLALPALRAKAIGVAADAVLTVSATQAAKLLRDGKVTAVELVEKCSARIDA
ncbi:MAG TPA: twin-arginine translocation signal domain-containing protein, partial [Gammaproteobacteria bacterium]|nr:twin-arginine translocation signal domain-containing protein [Gammaproteobacteria bacterium]